MSYHHSDASVDIASLSYRFSNDPILRPLLETLRLDKEESPCKEAFACHLLKVCEQMNEGDIASWGSDPDPSPHNTRRRQHQLLWFQVEAETNTKLKTLMRDWLTGGLENAFKYSKHNSHSKPSEDCTGCQGVLRFTTEAASAARALFELTVVDDEVFTDLERTFRHYVDHLESACLSLDKARIRAHPDQKSDNSSKAEFLAMVPAPQQLHDDVTAPLVATFGTKENSSLCNNEATNEAYSRATLALLAAYGRAPKVTGKTQLIERTRDSLATLREGEATSSDGRWNLLEDSIRSKPDGADHQPAEDDLRKAYQAYQAYKETNPLLAPTYTTEEW